MGLFDRVVKKAVGSVVGDALNGALGDKLEQVTGFDLNGDGSRGGATDVFGAPQQQAPNYPSQTPTASYAAGATGAGNVAYAAGAASAVGDDDDAEKDRDYFAALLAEKFSQYQLAGPGEPVGFATSGGKPYDFVLFQGGRPVAAITLTEKGRYRNEAFRKAKADCAAAGIPFINFFYHMPNRRGYIINRIKTELGLF